MHVMPFWIELEDKFVLLYFLHDLLDQAHFPWYTVDAFDIETPAVDLKNGSLNGQAGDRGDCKLGKLCNEFFLCDLRN